jgi:ribosome-associated translation inhibitor RaiA
MNIHLQTLHFKASAELEALVREKVKKLFDQQNDILRADVSLHEGEKSPAGSQCCEIRLLVPGNDFFAKKTTDQYEKSVTETVDALLSIIRRHKSRQVARNRKQRGVS